MNNETRILMGSENHIGHTTAMLIRRARGTVPHLSRYEHDILQGIENDLMLGNSGEMGFVGTAAAVGGISAAVKSGALKKVGKFFKGLRGKIKARRDARKGRGQSSAQDNAVLQTLTNVQAMAQEGATKYGAIAESIKNGFAPATAITDGEPVASSQQAAPMVYAPPVQMDSAPVPAKTSSMFFTAEGKPTPLTFGLVVGGFFYLNRKKRGR